MEFNLGKGVSRSPLAINLRDQRAECAEEEAGHGAGPNQGCPGETNDDSTWVIHHPWRQAAK